MKLNDKKLLEILTTGHYVSPEDALIIEKRKGSSPLLDYLFKERIITNSILGQAIAEYFKLPYWDLDNKKPSEELLQKLNPEFSQKYKVIIVNETETSATIATSDIERTEEFKAQFEKSLQKTVKVAYSLEDEIDDVLLYFKDDLAEKFEKIAAKEDRENAKNIVSDMLDYAVDNLASDIHIEPLDDIVIVRFRIDGILKEVGRISKDLYSKVLNRLKVLARLRIDLYNTPQDGSIRYKYRDSYLDLRISIVPITEGQKVVMRVLSRYVRTLELDQLGMTDEDKKKLLNAYSKTYGMILTVGPTGSGKTTTLYSLIKEIQDESINITTIEDPVEYRVRGINQIQVNLDTGITFAKGLRSIVRQDPNVILVGEIRDRETAEIGVNAALTGHLVLSTFHANDAATVVPRMIDMGIEPFLLASTLNLVIGQRLIRKLCSNCRYSYKAKISDIAKNVKNTEKYFKGDTVTLYKGKGCNLCGGTGYRGRVGIFEVIEVSQKIQDLINDEPSSDEIRKLADKEGNTTFFDSGIETVKSGVTSLEELLRVVPQT